MSDNSIAQGPSRTEISLRWMTGTALVIVCFSLFAKAFLLLTFFPTKIVGSMYDETCGCILDVYAAQHPVIGVLDITAMVAMVVCALAAIPAIYLVARRTPVVETTN